MELFSDRLILRPWTLEDTERKFEILKNGNIPEKCHFKKDETLEESRASTEAHLINDFTSAICEKDTGLLIGSLRYSTLEDDDTLSLGIWIADDKQGQGFGREACLTIMEYLFMERGLTKVAYYFFDGNTESEALCDSLGFRFYEQVQKASHDGIERLQFRHVMTRADYLELYHS